MVSAIFLAICSFGLSFLLTPLLRKFALRRGWVDRPDNVRKMHTAPVPRIGGIPIVAAYAGSFGILLLLRMHDSITVQQSFPLVWKLLPAALLVFATGLLDDLVSLKPWQKLLGVALAAGLACLGGLNVQSLAGYAVGGALGVPLTIIWLVGCTNAFNLIDGVDGVASGVGLLATLTILVAGLLHGDAGLVIATAPLAGALLGFLLFNFNPASIFLGDCGSLWVGFMLGYYGVIWSQKSATVLSITAPLMALSIPLLDLALSIVRRFLRREPIFGADRGHIHHRLLDRGLTPRRVALLLYAASGLAAAFSLFQSTAHNRVGGLVIALFCGVVWIGIQYLRYREFGIAVRLFWQNSLRSMVRSHLSLYDCEESLRAAASVDECWRAIRTAGHEFGFTDVALRLGGKNFHEQLNTTANEQWILHVPVSESEYVRLTCQFELTSMPVIVAPLVNLLHRTLSVKAAEFSARWPVAPQNAVTTAMRANVQPAPSQV
jgi:UDP-GlcNAc:undecaprenyl-phosphate GlcNAc-1-phosphate transferase